MLKSLLQIDLSYNGCRFELSLIFYFEVNKLLLDSVPGQPGEEGPGWEGGEGLQQDIRGPDHGEPHQGGPHGPLQQLRPRHRCLHPQPIQALCLCPGIKSHSTKYAEN